MNIDKTQYLLNTNINKVQLIKANSKLNTEFITICKTQARDNITSKHMITILKIGNTSSIQIVKT